MQTVFVVAIGGVIIPADPDKEPGDWEKDSRQAVLWEGKEKMPRIFGVERFNNSL